MTRPDPAAREAVFKIGMLVRFAHEAKGGPVHRVVSVMHDGMIELNDIDGYFAPHLFAVADDIADIPPSRAAAISTADLHKRLSAVIHEGITSGDDNTSRVARNVAHAIIRQFPTIAHDAAEKRAEEMAAEIAALTERWPEYKQSRAEWLRILFERRAFQDMGLTDDQKTFIASVIAVHGEYVADEWRSDKEKQTAELRKIAIIAERDTFEKYASALEMPLKNHDGHYANIRTRNSWLGWQARAALAQETTHE